MRVTKCENSLPSISRAGGVSRLRELHVLGLPLAGRGTGWRGENREVALLRNQMWCNLVKGLSKDCEFQIPTSTAVITAAEVSLGCQFPRELTELLSETNGVKGEYGLGLVWPIERIHEDNHRFRTSSSLKELYMSFDELLFFADAGNGDQFAFPICGRVIRRPDVFVWNHEDDSRTWVAPSLRVYLEWWLTGKIKI